MKSTKIGIQRIMIKPQYSTVTDENLSLSTALLICYHSTMGAILTEIQKRRSSEEPSELVWKSSESTPQPAEQEESKENDGIPSELKGATKWKTVKIKDPSTPSKASVFLGASDVCRTDYFVLSERYMLFGCEFCLAFFGRKRLPLNQMYC